MNISSYKHFSPALGSRRHWNSTVMTAYLAIHSNLFPVAMMEEPNWRWDGKKDEFVFLQNKRKKLAQRVASWSALTRQAGTTHDASHLLKAAAYYGGQARLRLHQTSCSAAQIVLQLFAPADSRGGALIKRCLLWCASNGGSYGSFDELHNWSSCFFPLFSFFLFILMPLLHKCTK